MTVALVGVIALLAVTVAEFRDDVNRREDLIPAAVDTAELSRIVVDQLAALDDPRAGVDEEAEGYRLARQRAAVLVGRLERELADRPVLAAELDDLRDDLLTWQAAVTSTALATGTRPGALPDPDVSAARAALTELVRQAESLTGAIATAVEDVAGDADQSRERFVWSVATAAGGALLLLLLGATALRRWVVVPVRRLSEDVSTVAAGDYDHPLRSNGGQELAQLAADVARMRDRFLSERDRATRADEAVDQQLPAVAALRTLLAPRVADPPPGLAVAGALLSAEGVLAGDWYDIAARDGELVVAIGDVCGHGVDAGVLAVRTKFALLDSIDLGLAPAAALDLAARRFARSDTFVTAFLAVIDPASGRCQYASAGHNPALIVRTDGTTVELPRTGPLIGFVDGPRPTVEVALHLGDLLVAYTDGVVEARDDARQQLLVEGLEAVVVQNREESPERITEAVLAQVLAHCGGRCTDDATVVVVRRLEERS